MTSARKTIFVVDDDPDLVSLIKLMIGSAYAVTTSTDPTAALATLTKGPAPDLLIFDVMMPGMDGLTLAKHVRALPHLAAVPLIFLTTRGGLQDVVAGINAGARHYITKPFKAANLLEKVEKLLR
jgi:DNA-binding response OmpR family regulator